ncbi:MAG: gliding motility-associated C-terminal domain-containing protein, partial [Flavobacteriales bacterium]
VTPYEYQVVYTLSGGEAPYDELAGGNGGVFAPATTFTTDWIDSGTAAASWTFSDVNNCNSIVENTNNFTCPDVTDAGTMSNAALSLCGAVAAGGTYNNDSSLDANDDMMWVLCTDCINPLTTMVGIPGNPNAISATFTFGAPMTYGTTYYMVAVAGDGVAGGLVNTGLVAPYIDFSNCQPITWYETPTATLSTLDNTVCQGESVTLEINFTGTGPWTFVLDHPVAADETITTSNDPHNITVNVAGTYDLNSVSTGPAPLGNLCTGAVMGSVNVVINPLPTATLSGSAAICTGDQHCFSIAFTGTAPLEVTIDDPDGTNEVIPGIPAPSPYNLYCVSGAGSYFITSVEDANGCENNTDGVASIITVNPLPIVTWTANQVSYCDGADATITLDIVGANGPFAAVFITPEILFPNLALVDGDDWNVSTPGDYEIVSVEDALGCISALGDIITVTEIALPAANAGPDLEECVGNDVQIGTMSGQAGVSYSWLCAPNYIVGASNIEQPTLNSNTAGTCNCDLTVTTTIGGCQSTDDVSVTYFDYPVVTTTANPDSLCAGDCTTLTAAGATSYVWDPGDNFAGGPGSNVVVCPSATAEYFVTGTENHPLVSCASVDSITVYTGEPLDTLIDYTEEVCFNTCNGEIHITILGGFGPFIVTGDIDNINETDLCPGIYNFTITDAIGCSISGSLEIEERLPEFIDIINITPPVCEYDLGCIEVIDNTTSIFINGCGYDTLVFSDSWQFCGLEDCCYDIQTLFEVAPGVYCSTDSTVCIDNISPDITFNAVWTEDTFCYEDEACFAAVPAGGTGGLAVDWYEDIDMNILLSSDNPWCFDMIEDVSAYGVALDQLGCFSDTVLVEATLYPAITMDLQNGADSVSICEYDCIDLIVEVGGGNGNVSIEWFELPNDINILSVNDTVNVCPLFATCYMVIADDQCSVPLSDTVCVHVWDTPEVLFETDTLEGCWPLEVWFYDVSLPVNDSLVSSYWEFDDGNSSNEFDTTMNIYSTPTLYAEFFPSLTLTTLHGCVGSDTLTDPIIVHGYPEVDFTWEPQPVTVLVHDSIQMINLTEGAETYFWNFYGNSTSSQINPIHTFPAFDMGVYPVCLTATTEYGCADTLCQDILVEAVLGVFVPNTFTPDGDGINDIFLPVVTGYKGGTYHFWIFNRWGDPLFYTEDPEKAWTGGSDGGEYYVNQDTYVWRLEVEALFDGKIEVYEGHVTILR